MINASRIVMALVSNAVTNQLSTKFCSRNKYICINYHCGKQSTCAGICWYLCGHQKDHRALCDFVMQIGKHYSFNKYRCSGGYHQNTHSSLMFVWPEKNVMLQPLDSARQHDWIRDICWNERLQMSSAEQQQGIKGWHFSVCHFDIT